MSSQKGNTNRSGAQKYQNASVFNNKMHDTSKKTKMITSLSIGGCCKRCTEIIEWKIKYKKYKPLSQAKTCIHCNQKTVKRAYCVMCQKCASQKEVCMKCGHKEEISRKPEASEAEEASQTSRLEQELKFLSERQRRTYHRLQASGKLQSEDLAVATAAVGSDEEDFEDGPASSDDGGNYSEGDLEDKLLDQENAQGPSIGDGSGIVQETKEKAVIIDLGKEKNDMDCKEIRRLKDSAHSTQTKFASDELGSKPKLSIESDIGELKLGN